jgi:hypothetical protein
MIELTYREVKEGLDEQLDYYQVDNIILALLYEYMIP